MPNGKTMPQYTVRDLEAERTRYAWVRTGQAKAQLADGFKEYANLTKSAPALIMNSGLMQTIAFYQGKDGAPQRRLVDDLCTWLANPARGPAQRPANPSFQTVMSWLAQADSARYRLATREVMSLLRWLKQFAAAREGD